MDGDEWFIIIVGAIFIFGIVMFSDVMLSTKEEKFVDTSIISLKDDSLIHGRFSLGSGYIDQEPVFIYYQVVGNGYQQKSAPTDMTIVIEDENARPFIRQFYSVSTGYVTKNRVIDNYLLRFELHVPQGTIIRDLKLDSEV